MLHTECGQPTPDDGARGVFDPRRRRKPPSASPRLPSEPLRRTGGLRERDDRDAREPGVVGGEPRERGRSSGHSRCPSDRPGVPGGPGLSWSSGSSIPAASDSVEPEASRSHVWNGDIAVGRQSRRQSLDLGDRDAPRSLSAKDVPLWSPVAALPGHLCTAQATACRNKEELVKLIRRIALGTSVMITAGLLAACGADDADQGTKLSGAALDECMSQAVWRMRLEAGQELGEVLYRAETRRTCGSIGPSGIVRAGLVARRTSA